MDYKRRKYPNRLRVIRQNAGFQQRQVAELLGQKSTIRLCGWESEEMMPSATYLIKLCILYNKDIQDLYPEYYRKLADDTLSLY